MPVSRVIRNLLTNLDSFCITNILILQHGDKSTGINLCRKNYNVLHITEKGGETETKEEKLSTKQDDSK